ncbi:MAG: NfeD family protein [Dehalococcoidales bacterium]|nr:MAG: NfeD family protein [Dehalococcoidales bacterium]
MNLIGEISIEPWVIVLIILCIIAFLVVTIIWGVKAHRFKIGAGKEEMIGKIAVVITVLDPKGTVFVEGEQWTAVSEEGRIEPGEEVTISRVDGLKIYVTKNNKGEI